ncbi:MAG: 50S ribosomal protein L17 [Candidatus Coatesbacteria bacterium]|nr:MAG: 50S ribosomal protein L17 [Candidatus Coatesbacteria bacterium]
MRHVKRKGKLGRTPSHRDATLRNLVSSLIVHEQIKTTAAKAKAVKPIIDRLVSRARTDTVHSRRLANRIIKDRSVIRKLYQEIAPMFQDRTGGYVRIVRGYPRRGDGASAVILEFIEKTKGYYELEKAREERRKAEKEKKIAAADKEKEMEKQMTGGQAAL